MIDKYIYKFFGLVDDLFEMVDEVLTFDFPNCKKKKKKDERHKVLEAFKKKAEQKLKEKNIFRFLRKEVEHGANGTRDYVIKKGINKGKIAK